MNSINFSQTGGFPMTTNILGRMQTGYNLFNALGNIVGDKTIISGCVVAGSNTGDGVVFINGEVFEFRGGFTQTKVIIKEDTTTLLFQNNNSYPVIKTRYVTFGTGVGAMDWADFKQGFQTKDIAALVQRIEDLEARPLVGNIPVGLIALWGRPANEIPAGWEEYTEMAGKMPIGFNEADGDFDVVGKMGGSKTHTLTIAEMPKHKHGTQVAIDGSGGTDMQSMVSSSNADEKYITGPDTEETGGDEPFNIMNPYRVVHFIKYVGV